jgi:hypothetical protein
MAAPQDGQNFTPSPTLEPQLGQNASFGPAAACASAGAGTLLIAPPQDGQNFTSSPTLAPQFEQIAMVFSFHTN